MVAKQPAITNKSNDRIVRRRNTEATRAAFLAEGETLFAKFGFDGVSLEQLAKQVGSNKTLASYHFNSKKGLYTAVIGNIVSDVTKAISERLRRSDDSVETFGNYIRALVFSFAERPTFSAILMREYIGGTMSNYEDAFKHVVKLFRLTDELYRSGVDQKKFKVLDPQLLHFSIVGPVIHFIVSSQFRSSSLTKVAPDLSNPRLEEFAEHQVEMILDGLVSKA